MVSAFGRLPDLGYGIRGAGDLGLITDDGHCI